MARDKLITIRIEGEKRDLFNQLAKSQNTDTASLLYDFISGCLDGTLDVGIVKGKKQRIDKIDNQIDMERIDNRLDKLETATQKIDNWILAFDDRLTDCDQGLSGKIISLEHRLNTLANRLDNWTLATSSDIKDIRDKSIAIDHQIETMEQLLKLQREASIASPIPPTGETSPRDEPGEGDTPEVPPSPPGTDAIASIDGTVEDADSVEPDSTLETVTDAIETLTGDTSPINDEGEDADRPAIELTNKEKAAILGIHHSNLSKWIKNQEIPEKYLNKCRFNENKSKIILT